MVETCWKLDMKVTLCDWSPSQWSLWYAGDRIVCAVVYAMVKIRSSTQCSLCREIDLEIMFHLQGFLLSLRVCTLQHARRLLAFVRTSEYNPYCTCMVAWLRVIDRNLATADCSGVRHSEVVLWVHKLTCILMFMLTKENRIWFGFNPCGWKWWATACARVSIQSWANVYGLLKWLMSGASYSTFLEVKM